MNQPLGYRKPTPGTVPVLLFPAYKSTVKRAPQKEPATVEATLCEVTGPQPTAELFGSASGDLTHFDGGEALGERIIVFGRVLDDQARPVRGALVEAWQANAAGRYANPGDRHEAPLDPHFQGVGRVVTGPEGEYRFLTIRPGAYPWGNSYNSWRPAHIHFSLFGAGLANRLVTQMYFPGDPLLPLDPIFNSVPDPEARQLLVCSLDLASTRPAYALAYRFDIVLRGRYATPMDE